MCMSCGCCEAAADHGDARHITKADLQAAADAAGISIDQAISNIQDCASSAKAGATPMSVIRRSYPAVVTKTDAKTGTVEAFVNTTVLQDLQADIMEAGSWRDVIAAAKAGETDFPSICWGHDWAVTTGKVIDADEVPPGDPRLPEKIAKAGGGAVRIVGQYNMDTQRGREAFSDVDFGAIKQWSVGFIPDEKSITWKQGVRRIGKVAEWPEVSNVLVGASPGTGTSSTKAAPQEGTLEERRVARLKDARKLAADFRETPKAASEKGGDLPDLTGDEAPHAAPLQQVLDGINTLIAQELAEPGAVCEYGDIISLCFVAQDVLRWARSESSEYGDMAMSGVSIWDLMAAGHAALSKQQEAAAQEVEEAATAAAKAWVAELIKEALTEAQDSSIHSDAHVHVGSDGLTHFARRNARPRF